MIASSNVWCPAYLPLNLHRWTFQRHLPIGERHVSNKWSESCETYRILNHSMIVVRDNDHLCYVRPSKHPLRAQVSWMMVYQVWLMLWNKYRERRLYAVKEYYWHLHCPSSHPQSIVFFTIIHRKHSTVTMTVFQHNDNVSKLLANVAYDEDRNR